MNCAHWRTDEFSLFVRPFRTNDGCVPDTDERVNCVTNFVCYVL
jgi:hypothetical protein